MSARDASGRTLEVHKIHQPDPLTMTEEEADGLDLSRHRLFSRPAGERLAGSYINFYIANGGIILPQFNDRRDRRRAAETGGTVSAVTRSSA